MKKVLISLAATLIMVAGFATNADAQRGRGGPGIYRGGGVVGVRGGGGGRFVAPEAAPALSAARLGRWPPLGRRAWMVGGGRWAGGRLVGTAPLCRRWICGRWIRWAPGYYGGYGGYGYGGGCRQWQVVGTPGDRSGDWSMFAMPRSAMAMAMATATMVPVGFYGGGY